MIDEIIEAVVIAPRPIALDVGMPVRRTPVELDVLGQPMAVMNVAGVPPVTAGGYFSIGPTARFHSLVPSGIALEVMDTSTSTWTEVWRYTG